MKYIKQILPEAFTLIVLSVLYFSTRLINLMSLPIFTDEAIYTRWAQIARFDSNWRFISLTDGKQPSFVWIDMILMKFFSDPLMAGRIVSVAAGFGTLIGIYFLTQEIFKDTEKKTKSAKIIGLIAAAVYVFFPFALVYDRMALYDSLVAAFFVWALYFQILLVRKIRFDIAMVLGFVLGGFVLTKSSGFLSIYLTPFLLILFNFSKKDRRSRLLKFFMYALVGIVIANVMYSVLRLSPFFHIIADKNLVFVQTPSEWLKLQNVDKVKTFISNARGIVDWFVTYFTVPYILLSISAFFLSLRFTREKILLAVWFILPFLALGVFGKTLYPRYILFMVMPLIPLVAYALFTLFERFKTNAIKVALVFVVAFLPLRMFYYVLFDISHAPIPRLDLEQYINGWPSGGGVSQSVEFFSKQSQNGPIFVATQGTFGLMPASYEIYLIQNKEITIKGYWPTNATIPEDVLEMSKKMPTYFVFYQDCSLCKFPGAAPLTWPLKEINSYQKGSGNTKLTVYQVMPEK